MEASKIKQELHKFIDGIESQEVLEGLVSYMAMENRKNIDEEAWHCLNETQQRELLENYEEVMNGTAILTPHEEMKKI